MSLSRHTPTQTVMLSSSPVVSHQLPLGNVSPKISNSIHLQQPTLSAFTLKESTRLPILQQTLPTILQTSPVTITGNTRANNFFPQTNSQSFNPNQ
jgi:hypothetical protein